VAQEAFWHHRVVAEPVALVAMEVMWMILVLCMHIITFDIVTDIDGNIGNDSNTEYLSVH